MIDTTVQISLVQMFGPDGNRLASSSDQKKLIVTATCGDEIKVKLLDGSTIFFYDNDMRKAIDRVRE